MRGNSGTDGSSSSTSRNGGGFNHDDGTHNKLLSSYGLGHINVCVYIWMKPNNIHYIVQNNAEN